MSKVSYRYMLVWYDAAVSLSTVKVGCGVFGWGKSGMWKFHQTAEPAHLSAKPCIWRAGRISLGLRTAVRPIVFCRLSDLQTLRANSTPIKSGQTSPRAFAARVKKWLLIWTEEYRFVSVAQNQSSAGELESVLLHCDLLTTRMKRVICPSVCSFIDKPRRLVWQRHLR